jgi:MFS family permease
MRSRFPLPFTSRSYGGLPIYALFLTACAAQAMAAPALPTYADRFHLGPTGLALILALPSITMLVLSTPLGRLGDRWGNHRLTTAAGLLVSTSAVLQAVPAQSALLTGRVLAGVGLAALYTGGLAWLSETAQTSPARRIASASTAAAVGIAAGPALAGTMIGDGGGASAFLIVGAVSVAATGMLVGMPSTPESATAHIDSTSSSRPSGWTLLRKPAVLAGAATLAVSGAVNNLFQFLVPVQLHALGYGPADIGLALAVGALAYIGVSATCVRVGSRLATPRINAWLAVPLAAALLPAALGSSASWVVMSLVASAVPRAVIATVSFAAATHGHGPGVRGAVLGILNTAWALPALLLPAVAPAIGAAGEPRSTYAVGVLAASAVAALLVWSTVRSRLPASPVLAG